MKVVSENIAMAPLKPLSRAVTGAIRTNQKASVSTRSRSSVLTNAQIRPKRKADFSPVKENVKRSAMGDITNNKKFDDKKKATLKQPAKKTIVQVKTLPSVRTVLKPKQNENVLPPQAPCLNGVVTRAAVKNVTTGQTAVKPKEALKEISNPRIKTRLSNEFEKTEESLYSSALEELSSGAKAKTPPSDEKSPNLSVVSIVAQQLQNKLNLGIHEVPEGVPDFDKENWDDVHQVSHYAMDIFNYMKSREPQFEIADYMDRQVCLTSWMRSLLVDWMVEVQESFELNHETLYLGVKLVDFYLSRMTVGKETLQLVGAASMFIASKYDERIPPAINDFLYICDGAYTCRELVRMEINILKVCDFNLGIPISYRFLRRYARCAKITMPVLTLARFILEYSLMDYATVTVRDSKLASASLYLALKMKKISGWTTALEFYSGYKLEDFKEVVILLNDGLHKKPKSPLMTVRNKYSHKIFFEVAKIPLISNEELFV
ncbi:G2/mitotic-specific cyclin-B3 isoform X2 [Tribolium castaneum]|uniref:G2/mitotic-specific cyclin-B3 isoform X2 n=1 Tax=Tribolium castaneum TaxID=7070 RepID=UPI00046C1568|nr:PREDICTED: G2/mitotic-specific cyclin-B3 isoform X2 [Tribolium castaneum]|eukprot:XP_008194308.1 PREDICTED: G2/mitotic-specific cyclin-B3 isoform X2 [Tribolium castaneum]